MISLIFKFPKTTSILAVVLLFSLAPESASAACSLKITNLKTLDFSGHFGRGYEVFDNDQHSEIGEVTLERKSGSCPFVIGFSAGGGSYAQRRLRSGSDTLNYQIFTNTGATQVLKDVPSANGDEVFSGVLSSGQDRITFRFVYIIPLLQVVPPGFYSDTISVRAYEGTVQTAQLRDQEQLTLQARVPTVAQFTMGDSVTFEKLQSDVCVDFGELTTGESKDLKLRARSNAGYRITMQSQNDGYLKVKDPSDIARIKYGLEIDCQPIRLGDHPVTAIQQSGTTPPTGREHTLSFTIGDVSAASAGDYQDVIQITMYPNR